MQQVLVQKGQTPRSGYAVGTQYAVGVSAKRSYGWWGPLPLVQKGQSQHSGYAVCSRYAVCSTQ